MAKRKPRSTAAPRAVALDHGPADRHGRLMRSDVEVLNRPDPDHPKGVGVHGARVRCLYHVLWLAGLLTHDQHEAADRFLVALEAAQGACESRAGQSGVRLAPWQQGHPAARQVQAAADLRAAKAALGPIGWAQMLHAVGANAWVPAWGKEPEPWDIASQLSVEPLRASLQTLVSLWRIDA
jgi:hypothetical protein